MGKRRNTAKTGDKKLYSSRGNDDADAGTKQRPSEGGLRDAFEDERDAEFLRLDSSTAKDNDDDDALLPSKRQVLDLGVGGDSSSSDDDSSEEDEATSTKRPQHQGASGSSEEDSDDDDDDDDDDDAVDDPRQWGRKKSSYYDADTGDLELGQDEEDAYVEEEAAREIQSSRFQDMDHDDFQLSEDDDDSEDDVRGVVSTNDDDDGATTATKTARDTSKLTRKDQRKLLKRQHPELLPIVSYFSTLIQDLQTTRVAAQALIVEGDELAAKSIGATKPGQEYLLTKLMLEQSVALNTALYLLIKENYNDDETVNNDDIEGHPLMAQLRQTNSILDKFGDHVHNPNLEDQVTNLAKAAKLLQQNGDDDDDESDSDDEGNVEMQEENANMDEEEVAMNDIGSVDEPDHDDGEYTVKSKKSTRDAVLDEARFGLRPHEVRPPSSSTKTKRPRRSAPDVGDIEQTNTQSFASTINAIQQRSQTRTTRVAAMSDRIDDNNSDNDDNNELSMGLRMMEEEMGKDFDKDDDGIGDMDDTVDKDELQDDDNPFYNAVAKQSRFKKQLKEQLYKVQPKFPRAANEVEGERALSRFILKNRGLVAHKAKINRNPRVKKREQYRKALIRRKGGVREVRTDEGHRYDGEETGIKARISRSRKLVS